MVTALDKLSLFSPCKRTNKIDKASSDDKRADSEERSEEGRGGEEGRRREASSPARSFLMQAQGQFPHTSLCQPPHNSTRPGTRRSTRLSMGALKKKSYVDYLADEGDEVDEVDNSKGTDSSIEFEGEKEEEDNDDDDDDDDDDSCYSDTSSLSDDDDENDDDDDEITKNESKMNITVSEGFVGGSRGRGGADEPIVIVFEDFEGFSGSLLQDFIAVFRCPRHVFCVNFSFKIFFA